MKNKKEIVKEETQQKLPDVPILEIMLVESGELVLRISKDLVPYFSKSDAAKITSKFEQLSKILHKAGIGFATDQMARYQKDSADFNAEVSKLQMIDHINPKYDDDPMPMSAIAAVKEAEKKHWLKEKTVCNQGEYVAATDKLNTESIDPNVLSLEDAAEKFATLSDEERKKILFGDWDKPLKPSGPDNE